MPPAAKGNGASNAGGNGNGKTVALLGLTFKANTDDMRDSPSLAIVTALQDAGATVRAYDPEGMEQAAKLLEDVTYCDDAYEAMQGADAAVIVTEWDAFRALDLERARETLRDYGNMSSATVLFVLKAILEAARPGAEEQVCSMAFGPGLTVETALLTAIGAQATEQR